MLKRDREDDEDNNPNNLKNPSMENIECPKEIMTNVLFERITNYLDTDTLAAYCQTCKKARELACRYIPTKQFYIRVTFYTTDQVQAFATNIIVDYHILMQGSIKDILSTFVNIIAEEATNSTITGRNGAVEVGDDDLKFEEFEDTDGITNEILEQGEIYINVRTKYESRPYAKTAVRKFQFDKISEYINGQIRDYALKSRIEYELDGLQKSIDILNQIISESEIICFTLNPFKLI
jgi:hypothetical protein